MRARFILISVLVLLAPPAMAQTFDVQVKPGAKLDYSLVQQLSSGPTYGFSDGKVRGKYLRLVVIESALAYDAPILRIEHLTYGDEACCRTVVKVGEIEISEAFSMLVGPYSPESDGLTIVRWLGPTKVEIKYKKMRFILSDLDRSVIKVRHENR